MFKNSFGSSSDSSSGLPSKKTYQHYRKIGTALNHKIIDTVMKSSDTALMVSAKALRMKGRGRELIFESEDDMSVLMEYLIYEYRTGSKNAIERYREEIGGANEIEKQLLDAMVSSSTSLFKIDTISPKTYSLNISDLLNPDNSLILIDINFSQTCRPGLLFFIRPIMLETFSVTSGVAFVFPPQEEEYLVKQAAKLTRQRKLPHQTAKLYQTFFKLSKRRGIEVMYQ